MLLSHSLGKKKRGIASAALRVPVSSYRSPTRTKKPHNLIVFQSCTSSHVYCDLDQLSGRGGCFGSYLCLVSLHPVLQPPLADSSQAIAAPLLVTGRRIWVIVYHLLPSLCFLSLRLVPLLIYLPPSYPHVCLFLVCLCLISESLISDIRHLLFLFYVFLSFFFVF